MSQFEAKDIVKYEPKAPLVLKLVKPHLILPTKEMITQGKEDYEAVIRKLPRDVFENVSSYGNLAKGLLSSANARDQLLGFMGYRAHDSHFEPLIFSKAALFRSHIIGTTQGRMDLLLPENINFPGYAGIELINTSAAQRIIKAFPGIFPDTALDNVSEWIEGLRQWRLYLYQTGNNNSERQQAYHLYYGLLSGFPPKSVFLYARGDRTGKPMNGFVGYGDIDETIYLEELKRSVKESKMIGLLRRLRKEFVNIGE